MEIAPLIKPLESAIADPELRRELGTLASLLSYNKPPSGISETVLIKAESLQLIKRNATVIFNSAAIQSLFYVIQFTSEKINDESSDQEIVEFLSGINKSHFPSIYDNSWHLLREVIYLLTNRLFGHDVPRLITERKIYSRSILHAYWDLLPYLHSSPDNLVNALFLATLDIKAEGNYINLNQAVRKCAQENIEFAKVLLESCLVNKQKLDLFFTYTFLGYAQAIGLKNAYPHLHKMLTSANKDFVIAGLRTLAWLHGYNDQPQDIQREFAPVLEDLETKKDDQITSSIILAYGLLIDKLDNARQKLGSLISDQLGPDSRFMLSHLISLNIKTGQDEKWFQDAMNLLTNLNGQHVGTYMNLSRAFAYAFDKPPELFYSFIDKYIENDINDSKSLQGFRNVFEASITNDKERFEKWLTLAFNNDNRNYQHAAREVLLMVDRSSQELRLSKEVMNQLTPFDLEFILFKIVGNVYAKEHLQSLTYSALDYNDTTGLIPQVVTELFALYILYNYPGTIKFLREKKETAGALQASVIKVVEQHYNEVHMIKEEKPLELSPSAASLQKQFRKFSEQFKDFKDESPFRQPRITDFITHITMVKGNSFFHRDGMYGGLRDKYKSKSTMGKVAVEMEMPGGEFVDPIGQEYNRHYWRTFKRRTQ